MTSTTKSPSNLFVSVIVPVFNDSERLKLCLDALDQQTYPRSLFEVVVVDNGSTENIPSVVSQFPQIRFHHEPNPGSYAARNSGISAAGGEVLAFTDSDCIPRRDWIEKGVEEIQKFPDCGLVAGRINMFFRNPDCLTAVELYEKMYSFDQKDNVQKKRFGVTANLFVRKEIIDAVGPFNAALKSGGDLEWGNRVFDAGFTLIYADKACVQHPARHSLRQLYKKRVRVLGGLNALNEEKPYTLLNGFSDLKNIAMYTLWLLKCFLRGLPPSEKFENTRQKAQYLFILPYVRAISVFEKLRLHSGGKARR